MPAETAAKRRRTASKGVRRRQLIEATIDSIAENGLSGTTMAAVTGAAQLSLGIVSFHFKSKENLLKETLIYLADEHRNCWARSLENSALDPAAKLSAMIDAHFHPTICTKKRIAVWFAFFGEPQHRATYRKKVSQFDMERADVAAQLCRKIIEDGGYSDIDPVEIAKSLECFADGLWLSLMMYPDWLCPEDAKRQIYQFLARTFPQHFSESGAPALRRRA